MKHKRSQRAVIMPIITADLCKAARILLGWSQEYLAYNSMISISTIANFERKKSQPSKKTLITIEKTITDQNILIINDGQCIGVIKENP